MTAMFLRSWGCRVLKGGWDGGAGQELFDSLQNSPLAIFKWKLKILFFYSNIYPWEIIFENHHKMTIEEMAVCLYGHPSEVALPLDIVPDETGRQPPT